MTNIRDPEDPWADSVDDPCIYRDRTQRVSVVVPARNEALCIGPVLSHCKPYADELIVVDGHSTDETREIAEAAGARVLLDSRKGKGAAIRLAIREVTGDIVVFIDADHSHSPHDIPRLVAPILRGQADHVVGSRSLGGSDELHGDFSKFMRLLGSNIITLGINYRFNVCLTESQNGFRALRTEVARNLDLREDITTIEQEMTIKTLARNYRIMEVPAHEYARSMGESKIKLTRVSFRYVYSWLKYLALS